MCPCHLEQWVWETCDNSRFWESLFAVLNWPSVKFCIPYRLILQVVLCCGLSHEDKDKNLALGLKLEGKLVCSCVGSGSMCSECF